MADIEAPIRQAAMRLLDPWFLVREEHPVTLRTGQAGTVDILAVPRDERFSNFAWAIEVKARSRMTERGLAAWIKQASDYVGATPRADFPIISSGFLWMVGMIEPETEREQIELRAKIDVAHQFRVGVALSARRQGIAFQMGPDLLFRSSGWGADGAIVDPWPGRAMERLSSGRQSAGIRRRIGPRADDGK